MSGFEEEDNTKVGESVEPTEEGNLDYEGWNGIDVINDTIN